MISTAEKAIATQSRRAAAGKTRMAKAVRRYFRREQKQETGNPRAPIIKALSQVRGLVQPPRPVVKPSGE